MEYTGLVHLVFILPKLRIIGRLWGESTIDLTGQRRQLQPTEFTKCTWLYEAIVCFHVKSFRLKMLGCNIIERVLFYSI